MREKFFVSIEENKSFIHFPGSYAVKVDANDVINWLEFVAYKNEYHVEALLMLNNIMVRKTNSPRWMYPGVGKLIAVIDYTILTEKLKEAIADLISFEKISELTFPLSRKVRGVMLHRWLLRLGGMLVEEDGAVSRIVDKKSGNIVVFHTTYDLKPFWDPVLFVPRQYITMWHKGYIIDKKRFQKYIADLSLRELNMYADFINELVESGFIDKQQLNKVMAEVIRDSESNENMLLLASLLN